MHQFLLLVTRRLQLIICSPMSTVISKILINANTNSKSIVKLFLNKNINNGNKIINYFNQHKCSIRTIPFSNQTQINAFNSNSLNTIKINFIRNSNNSYCKSKFKTFKNYIRSYNQQLNSSKPSPQTTQNATKGGSNSNTIGNVVNNLEQQQVEVKIGIFKRFKEAYRKHGKVLIACHVTTCIGWFCGFYLLSRR